MEVIHKIGRRKTAVARIYMKEGSGKITINKRDLANYFTTPTLQYKVKQPFALLGLEDAYDLNINVYGGGILDKQKLSALRSPALCAKWISKTERCLSQKDCSLVTLVW